MKRLRTASIAAFAIALIAVAAFRFDFVAHAATVINDVFADGSSANQDLPNNSLGYYTARGNTRVDAVGSTTFNFGSTSSDAIWAYFTNSGAPINLGVGDSTTLTVDFSMNYTTTSGAFRFGFFNSNGSRAAANIASGGQNNAAFGDDPGYAVEFFPNAGGPFAALYRRDVTSPVTTNIFNSLATTAGFQPITGSGSPTTRQVLQSGQPYTYTFTVKRLSATETQLTVKCVGPGVDETHTGIETSATPYTAFDWFTFRVGGSALASSIRFTRVNVDYTPAAPVITTHPAPVSASISAGANTSYSVVATGNGLSYQWLKDDNAITNNATATTATLSLTNAQTTDTGIYKVVVSNAGGSATSNPVSLTVVAGPTDPIPVINQDPQSTTAAVGTPASLSVAATGPNLLYQWFKGNDPIGGADGPTLSFPSVTLADTGDYKVNVSNGGGTVTSAVARLTVVSAMNATAVGPVNGAAGVCADKPLSITFDQAPKVGTSGTIKIWDSNGTLVDTIDMAAATQARVNGGVSFRYYPIIVEGNTANIYPHAILGYNKTYYVTIDPGVITDAGNAPYAGFTNPNTFRFSTKASAPAAGSAVLTVDDDGPADFCTIQAAIDFVPANNTQRVVINVKDGTYTEIIYIPSNKPFITVKGESRAGTVQRYANNATFVGAVSGNFRTSFGVDAADFRVENITLWNTTPQNGSQAEALRTNGLRAVVANVNLKSFQDTLLTQKSAFVTDSYIEGDVDFMWGNGQTYFKNTEIKQLRESLGYYTQIRNNVGTVGNVYVGCTFTKGPGVTNGSYLGRIDPDDFPGSQVVIIDSKMDTHIRPEGWLFNTPSLAVDATNYPNIRYWESGITKLDGSAYDCSQRHPIARTDCSNPLSPAERAFYTDPVNVTGFTPDANLTTLVTISNTTQVYDGSPKPVTVTTDPAGVTVSVLYNGNATVPTEAGTYTVTATVTQAGYVGSASGTLTIQKAPVAVAISNLTQVYDGAPKPVTVTTTPGLIPVSVTYNASATVPSAVGNYTVVATVAHPNYVGSATAAFNLRANVKAFSTAEGAGQYAAGGRGGDTYHVTNLNDSGAGSLRDGISTATGPRTIVFDVAGTINLNSRLNINKPFITIAGQTAPGGGITIAGWSTVVNNTQHVIIRYVRFRPGDIRCANGMEGDSLWVDNSKDVMIDHVSASWSIDESLSVTDSDRVSVQWSFITESLGTSCHPEGSHGYGALIRFGAGNISYHHNLFAHHLNRNPRVGDNITLDFVNNVIYDWGTDASYSGAAIEGVTKVNYLGNYLVAGPNTPVSKRTRAFSGGSVNTLIYQSGNFIDSNVNAVRDGADTGWTAFVGLYTQQAGPLLASTPSARAGSTRKQKVRTVKSGPSAPSAVDINVEPAADAYRSVLLFGGASKSRDSVDSRVADQVRTDTGAQINSQTAVGGWPALAAGTPVVDTDGDGMSDAYETANGLNPLDPADASTVTPTGYTNLENYLANVLAIPTAADGSIAGRVMTAGGAPLAGVTVLLTDLVSGRMATTVTAADGTYGFRDLETGQAYLVTASADGRGFVAPVQVVDLVGDVSGVDFTTIE